MSLIVAPDPGFNSYASVVEADAYFTDYDNQDWLAATTPAKTSALLKGSAYIYGLRLIYDYVSPVVYPNVKYATFEAAVRALKGTLYRDVPATELIAETVGPIQKRWQIAQKNGQPRFKVIDDLLLGMVYPQNNISFLRA